MDPYCLDEKTFDVKLQKDVSNIKLVIHTVDNIS